MILSLRKRLDGARAATNDKSFKHFVFALVPHIGENKPHMIHATSDGAWSESVTVIAPHPGL